MERTLLLDDGLPVRLAGELAARGRRVGRVDGALTDAQVLELLDADAVLVTTDDSLPREHAAELRRRHGAVALVVAHDEPAKREAVHRWAHAMAAQPRGSLRRYGPRRTL